MSEPSVRISNVAPRQWCVITEDRIDALDGISAYVDLKVDSTDFCEYYKCQRHKKYLSVNAPAACYKNACSDIMAVIEYRVVSGEWKPPVKEA